MFFGIYGCTSDAERNGHSLYHFTENRVFAIQMGCPAHAGLGLFLLFIEGTWRIGCQRFLGLDL